VECNNSVLLPFTFGLANSEETEKEKLLGRGWKSLYSTREQGDA